MPEDVALLRLPAVMALTGYKRTAIYEKITKGEFPGAIRLGARAVAWRSDEVHAWIRGRIDATRAAA